jgi:uncharacterized protein (UPF0303 family)
MVKEKYLIPSSDYAARAGAFPLIIRDVGTLTVLGLPQQVDHELVVTTLKQFLAKRTEERVKWGMSTLCGLPIAKEASNHGQV